MCSVDVSGPEADFESVVPTDDLLVEIIGTCLYLQNPGFCVIGETAASNDIARHIESRENQ